MQHRPLTRTLGTPGAVLLGLGSILGTGVFVSIGLAAGVAGPLLLPAIALAALLALCNALSSAQLAAAHPVAGGTYEYGYRYLFPAAGFTAGWMFVCAKSASAATAALGLAGYALHAFGLDGTWLAPAALVVVALLTTLVAGGIRRSARANAVIVAAVLTALVAFVLAGLPDALAGTATARTGDAGARGLLHATALMFVAYAGYGRIATLSEEIREPARNIPRAIVLTLAITAAVYLAVAAVALAAGGADMLAAAARTDAAPLEAVARGFGIPGIVGVVAAGAVIAMLGVLLNLLLGVSRVMLAMGRRGDLPAPLARLNAAGTSPTVAVWATGALVAALAASGSVAGTWSFAAFTVLIYYALTNLAALRLPAADRRYPRAFAWAGLAGCLALAFWVEPRIWALGLSLIALGLLWHRWRQHQP
ncbi:amino acid transporter [Salinisphaera sp. PC39]|uniref:APC family permease n=1 Tax=Salinisphaera sp. PC39 TaxID=1304156 RepID=UPI00333F40F6